MSETDVHSLKLAQARLDRWDAYKLLITVFHVAWLAILAGIVAQLAVLLLKTVWVSSPGSMGQFLVDTLHKVSWSVLVCIGLMLATIANQARPLLTGICGMLAAPLAIIIARAAQKSLAQVLNIPVDNPPLNLVLIACGIKAVQYLALGFLLGWLSLRPEYTFRSYMLGGLLLGIVFGTILLMCIMFLAPKRPPGFELASRFLNELIQPIGCALAYFGADRLSKMLGPIRKG